MTNWCHMWLNVVNASYQQSCHHSKRGRERNRKNVVANKPKLVRAGCRQSHEAVEACPYHYPLLFSVWHLSPGPSAASQLPPAGILGAKALGLSQSLTYCQTYLSRSFRIVPVASEEHPHSSYFTFRYGHSWRAPEDPGRQHYRLKALCPNLVDCIFDGIS